MNRIRRGITLSTLTLLVAATSLMLSQQRRAETALRAAIETETVRGLSAAIDQYKLVAETYRRSDPAIAAQALLRMAEGLQKLGNIEAQEIYRRIIRDFSEQKEAVAQAQKRLRIQSEARTTATIFRKVWNVFWPVDVSMDGRYVAHLSPGGNDLSVHDLSTRTDRAVITAEPKAVGSITTVTFSRDGKRVAYDWCENSPEGIRCELRVVDIQPSGISTPRTFFASQDVEFPYPVDWSPDGKSVAARLVRKDGSSCIGIVAIEDGSIRELTSLQGKGRAGAVFSADGRWLAFDKEAGPGSDQRDVFIIPVDGSSPEIPAVVHRNNDKVVGWSPDGSLLFTSNRNGGSIDLWSMGFREGRVQGFAEFIKSAIGSPLRVTDSGAVFATTQGSDRDIEIASMDLATGKQLAAPTHPIDSFIGTNSEPTFSPDGSLLAYQSRRGGPPLIVIRSEKTGEAWDVRPKPELTWFRGLSWWPDGASFAVVGTDDKGGSGIFRIDARSGLATMIGEPLEQRDDIEFAGFSFSPDGRYMYFRGKGAIWERDLASGTQRTILSRPTVSPSVSPDGRWLAAARQGAMLVVAPTTGEEREILRLNPGERISGRMPWTPDGRGIIARKLQRDDTSELWLVSTVGEPLLKLDIDANRIASGTWSRMDLHADGRRLVFPLGEVKVDVWVLENFQTSNRRTR